MQVEVRNNNVEQALKVLKRKLMKSGVLKVVKQKEYYEKPSAKRARKKKDNIKNCRKRRSAIELKPKKHRHW
jgi:small subunit ribosomal protein S21